MDPKQFIKTYGWDEVDRICAAAGTKRSWFHHIALGYNNCGLKLAKRLVQASEGRLDLWSLIDAESRRQSA